LEVNLDALRTYLTTAGWNGRLVGRTVRARDKWCALVFEAILIEEQDTLTSSRPLIEKLREAVAAI
jgi:hypothetical protein